jgi:hypothetical protein
MILSQLHMAVLVAGNAGECVGAVIGLSLGLLAAAALTGGAALAVGGAYAPLLAVFC